MGRPLQRAAERKIRVELAVIPGEVSEGGATRTEGVSEALIHC